MHEIGFTFVDKFSAESHVFEQSLVSSPIISVVKFESKLMVLKILITVERFGGFQIKFCEINTKMLL